MARKNPRTKNQVVIDPKPIPKTKKTQGQFHLGTKNFIDKIIHLSDSQASVSPRTTYGKGSTMAPQVARPSTVVQAEIHDKTLWYEKSFQGTSINNINCSSKGEGIIVI